MDARLIVVIAKDRILQDVLKLSGDDLDVIVTRSCSAVPLLQDSSQRQIVIIDFALEGSFELLSEIRTARNTAVICLADAPEVLEKLSAIGVEHIFDRDVDTGVLVDTVRQCLTLLRMASAESEFQVLVVEDDKDIRDIVFRSLTRQGFRVLRTDNGNVALQMIGTTPDIGVVLLDVNIPGRGGIEVLSEIRQYRPEVAVIMITGVLDREIARRAMTIGAFDYVIKPFDVSTLPGLITAALGHRDFMQRPWWKRLIG